VVLFTAILEAIMIGLAFGWVAIYSNLIAPGGEVADYQAYARIASPIVSLIAGPIVFGIASFQFNQRGAGSGRRHMWWILALYLLLDIVIVFLATEELTQNLLLWLPNALTKTAGVWLGARLG
jgi:hypothetical protein